MTLEVPDPAAAGAFYRDAFGLGDSVGVRASDGGTGSHRMIVGSDNGPFTDPAGFR